MNDPVETTALNLVIRARDARNARLARGCRRALKRARRALDALATDVREGAAAHRRG